MTNKIFTCQRTKQERKIIEDGIQRLNTELEVDKFIKLQMKTRIALRCLFTKAENFLLRRNRDFVLNVRKPAKALTNQTTTDD